MLTRKTLNWMCWAIRMSFCSAFAFLGTPFCDYLEGAAKTAATLAVASLFWLSVILGQVCIWKCNAGRKVMERKVFRWKTQNRRVPGIFRFFSCGPAIWADGGMLISMAATAVLLVLRLRPDWLPIFPMAAFLLSFSLHCIFNGVNYHYLQAYQQHKKERKRK